MPVRTNVEFIFWFESGRKKISLKLNEIISSTLASTTFFKRSTEIFFPKISWIKFFLSLSISWSKENSISDLLKVFFIFSESSNDSLKTLEISLVIWFPPIGIV